MTKADQRLSRTAIGGEERGEPPIYLDHNASTQPDPEVVEAMLPWLGAAHCNPHSEHRNAARASAAIEDAKAAVADLIGADTEDIVFTSGATESNNLILQGLLTHGTSSGALVISAIEHKSVIETAFALRRLGVDVATIPVNQRGEVDLFTLEVELTRVATANIKLVSIMHANNEIGILQPLARISEATMASGAYFHSDATQSYGKVPIDVGADGVDFMSMSAHKVYGPSGIGAVYIAPGLREYLRPIMFGGGQQGGLRPGTVPVFLAVGFGAASRLAAQKLEKNYSHCKEVTEQFLKSLAETGLVFDILGDFENGLPGLISLRLPGVDASELVGSLGDALYASTGSACTSGELQASHVLRAIGLNEMEGSEVVRLGFGRGTTLSESRQAAQIVAEIARRQRKL